MTTAQILAYETLRQLRDGPAPITLAKPIAFHNAPDAIAERALVEVSRWQRTVAK